MFGACQVLRLALKSAMVWEPGDQNRRLLYATHVAGPALRRCVAHSLRASMRTVERVALRADR